LAEVLDREPRHLVRLLPRRGARPVERLDQDAAPARGVPAEVGGGGPGEVTHVAGGEAPGLRSRDAFAGVRFGLRLGDDLYALGPHTTSGFATVPVAATTNPAGRVSDTSKSPYSR